MGRIASPKGPQTGDLIESWIKDRKLLSWGDFQPAIAMLRGSGRRKARDHAGIGASSGPKEGHSGAPRQDSESNPGQPSLLLHGLPAGSSENPAKNRPSELITESTLPLLGRRAFPLGHQPPDNGQVSLGITVVRLDSQGMLKMGNCLRELPLLGERHSQEGVKIG